MDTEYDLDEPTEDLKAAADKKQAEIAEIMKAEAEKVAKLRVEHKDKVPRMNISLVLSKLQRDRFKNKWKEMAEDRRLGACVRGNHQCESHLTQRTC